MHAKIIYIIHLADIHEKSMKMLLVAFFAFALVSGCASSVGWGQKYEIIHKNSKSITVKYDSIIADIADFAPIVDSHCARFGKEAVPEGRIDSQSNSSFGGIQTVAFRCE